MCGTFAFQKSSFLEQLGEYASGFCDAVRHAGSRFSQQRCEHFAFVVRQSRESLSFEIL